MRDSTILVIGAGIFLGFLGFLSYLSFLSSRQQYPTVPSVPPETREVCIPQSCPPVYTEETRPTVPHIMNQILNSANIWYEIPIPKDIKTWSMNARGDYDIYYAFEPSHATYKTLFSGTYLDSDTAPNNISKIYVSCDTANAVVEIMLFR